MYSNLYYDRNYAQQLTKVVQKIPAKKSEARHIAGVCLQMKLAKTVQKLSKSSWSDQSGWSQHQCKFKTIKISPVRALTVDF